jgi:hypothetical protein
VGINPDMGLHAEVPLLALLALVHVRIALAVLVLRRRRRRYQRGIDNRAFPQQQALLGQVPIDGVETGMQHARPQG